jgi:hypothetical protein
MEIPKVFANPLHKNISNNEKTSYNKLEEKKINKEEILKKINDIFKSDEKIYSIDCIIKFDKYQDRYRIIGKTTNYLVTINKNLINIDDIKDIKLAEKK